VDLCGVITSFKPTQTVTTKDGVELTKREITVADDTATSFTVTLWGDRAKQADSVFEGNPTVVLKTVSVKEFRDSRSGSLAQGGELMLNPDMPEATKAQQWWKQGGSSLELKQLSEAGPNSAPARNATATSLAGVRIASERLGLQPELFSVVARLALVQTRKKDEVQPLHYMACQQPKEGTNLPCNKRVDEQGVCPIHGVGKVEPRVTLRCRFVDFEDATWLTSFHEASTKIIGKSGEEIRAMELAAAAFCKGSLLIGSALASTPAGSFQVTEGSYDLGGFLCGKQESQASIWYPTDLSQGPFPIVAYGHGMGGQMIPDLIESVASLGMVVVAPATSAGKCDENHWKDMLHAIEGSKAEPSLHSALAHVDWTRVGIMGHSMGGYASLNAAADVATNPSQYSFSLKAMLDSHGYIGDFDQIAPKITIPAMFTTGTEDRAEHLKGAFDLVNSENKVMAQVTGADHMYPATNGALNPWDAHFMGCHVADLESSCTQIYGSGADSICKGNSMTQCEVVGSSPLSTEEFVA
jgi:hypothetical protein